MLEKERTTKNDIITGSLVKFYLDENGVFHLEALDKLITSNELEKDYLLIKDYLKDECQRPPVIYDASKLSPIDKKIRTRLDELLQEVFCALAVHSKSKMGVMIASIFFTLAKSSVPRKIFSNKEDAYQWIKKQTIKKPLLMDALDKEMDMTF